MGIYPYVPNYYEFNNRFVAAVFYNSYKVSTLTWGVRGISMKQIKNKYERMYGQVQSTVTFEHQKVWKLNFNANLNTGDSLNFLFNKVKLINKM
jgi:hypothetical protein